MDFLDAYKEILGLFTQIFKKVQTKSNILTILFSPHKIITLYTQSGVLLK